LTTSLRKDNVGHYVHFGLVFNIAFDSNKARFFCVLEVIAMPLSYLAIDRLLNPSNLINKFILEVFHHFKCKSVFGVNHPDEEEAVGLEFVKWNVEDLLIVKSIVGNSNTSSGIG